MTSAAVEARGGPEDRFPDLGSDNRASAAIYRRLRRPLIFLLSSLIGLVVGGIIIAITGHNPIDAYRGLADGALIGPNFSNLQYTVDQAIPIVGMGIATAIAF